MGCILWVVTILRKGKNSKRHLERFIRREREREWVRTEKYDCFLVADVATLVLLGGMSSVSSTAVYEGLRLLVRILQHSEKSHDSHIATLCKQVSKSALTNEVDYITSYQDVCNWSCCTYTHVREECLAYSTNIIQARCLDGVHIWGHNHFWPHLDIPSGLLMQWCGWFVVHS